MIEKLKFIQATRKKATTKTKRAEFDELHYGLDRHGDYCELYVYEDGQYIVYRNNLVDQNKNTKNKVKRADREFDFKFRELNGLSLRRAYGFVDKGLKRCIPKQFYFINEKYLNRLVKASSIDASSQYPSGCLGRLPTLDDDLYFDHYVEPTEEYPFAFYASGHCAEYGVFDTHNWLDHKLAESLFRFNPRDDYPLRPLDKDHEHTILMKASPYTMDSTWNYFYNLKNKCQEGTEEYDLAKLVMNATIGCWHRKDKNKKRIMSYDDHGSYQLAHIAAIAIARGNQKILNMLDEISPLLPLTNTLHICVDGIIYLGDKAYGINEKKFGEFKQEYTGADFMMTGTNTYCVRKDGHCIKFKHSSYDLLDGEPIDETKDFTFEDLYKLGRTERVGDYLWQEK